MKPFLIADDSSEKILMLRHFLTRAGFTGSVCTAATCEEAYTIIDREPEIAYAFIDYYIPRDYGPAIIKKLRAQHPACRIALVSSSDRADNAEEAREAGADAVLCTTHRSDEVEHDIMNLLAEWQAASD